MTILRTNATNPDFIELVKQLDAYLRIVDGEDHAFYNQYNGIEVLNHVVVAYEGTTPVGCGAFKPYPGNKAEIKRMYSHPKYRNTGVATLVLTELENWASELNYESCLLETGKRQVEAVAFYQKNGYELIDNFGQYAGVANSLCFEKALH